MSSPDDQGSDGDCDAPLIGGPLASSQRGADDRAYAEALPGKICAVPPDGSIEWADDVVRMPVGGVTIEGEIAHAHFATDDTKPGPPGRRMVFDVVAVPPVAPMLATVGSMTFHGAPLAPGIGSTDVFAEGKPVFRMLCDVVACPAATPLPHVGGVVMPLGPPSNVFVNGFAVARAGDAVIEPLGGPNPIMLGASTIFAGSPAPPMMSVETTGHPAEDDRPVWQRGLDWVDKQVEFDIHARADVHLGETAGKADVGVAVGTEDYVLGPEGHIEGGGSLVRVDGEVVIELSVFGEKFELVDESFDSVVGKWKGHGDIIFDPIQRRPGASGDIGFGDDDE